MLIDAVNWDIKLLIAKLNDEYLHTLIFWLVWQFNPRINAIKMRINLKRIFNFTFRWQSTVILDYYFIFTFYYLYNVWIPLVITNKWTLLTCQWLYRNAINLYIFIYFTFFYFYKTTTDIWLSIKWKYRMELLVLKKLLACAAYKSLLYTILIFLYLYTLCCVEKCSFP